jgi:hypothetical protein
MAVFSCVGSALPTASDRGPVKKRLPVRFPVGSGFNAASSRFHRDLATTGRGGFSFIDTPDEPEVSSHRADDEVARRRTYSIQAIPGVEELPWLANGGLRGHLQRQSRQS